jgi:hypothetical protein
MALHLPSGAGVKNDWSYTCPSPIRLCGLHRENLTLTIHWLCVSGVHIFSNNLCATCRFYVRWGLGNYGVTCEVCCVARSAGCVRACWCKCMCVRQSCNSYVEKIRRHRTYNFTPRFVHNHYIRVRWLVCKTLDIQSCKVSLFVEGYIIYVML